MSLSNMYGHARVLIDSDYHRMGKELIQPFDSARVQPASYDVTLGDKILFPRQQWDGTFRRDFRGASMPNFTQLASLDLRKDRPSDLMVEHDLFDGYPFGPGKVALVSTREQVRCPNDMICSVDGKSTLGRIFLAVHVTAGFIDPGYCGAVTMELVNHGPWILRLYPGMPIGQLRFTWLGKEVDRPYGSPGLGSHYQGAAGVQGAEGFTESP